MTLLVGSMDRPSATLACLRVPLRPLVSLRVQSRRVFAILLPPSKDVPRGVGSSPVAVSRVDGPSEPNETRTVSETRKDPIPGESRACAQSSRR